jgi:tryptophanyl-tRNA synthetase
MYFIVDLHALTVKQDPKKFAERIRSVAALYIALGLDPKKTIIFIQSHVHEHAELCWILNNYTMVAELERMTQYKDKAGQDKENVNVGLFDYPVLMAADILLYNTDLVPVGEDQSQHVELARTIAKRFNHQFGETFKVPELFLGEHGARIIGLDDPTKKMSKSASSEYNYISLLDQPEDIRRKFKKAVTDSGREIRFDVNKPAIYNLLTIYELLTNKTQKEVENNFINKGYADLKKELAEVTIKFLKPIQKKYREIYSDTKYLDQILEDGAERARKIARPTLAKVKQTIGLI